MATIGRPFQMSKWLRPDAGQTANPNTFVPGILLKLKTEVNFLHNKKFDLMERDYGINTSTKTLLEDRPSPSPRTILLRTRRI